MGRLRSCVRCFGERESSGRGVRLLDALDYVNAAFGVHVAGDLADGEREGDILEGLLHLSTGEAA